MHSWRLIVAGAVSAGLLATAVPITVAKTMSGAAEIMSLEGGGEFRENESLPWKKAMIRQGLFAGNVVRTAAYSRMGLLFRDRTQIRLREKSVLLVKDIMDPSEKTGRTVLRLNSGRAWAQSKTAPRGLIIETPSATAAIRGTDWELEIEPDGAATITVLSGEVQFSNDRGSILVRRNEQARAEIGKAPVKMVIVNPKERVQWVSAYAVDPLRHIVLHSALLNELQRDLAVTRSDSSEQKADRGTILVDLGQWREAEELFTAALSQEAANGKALIGMAFASLRRGKTSEAEECLGRAERAGKQADEELISLGRAAALIQKGQIGHASDLVEQLVKGTGQRQPAAWLIQSDLMIYAGEVAKSEQTVRGGLQLFPDSALLYNQMGRIMMITDRLDAAEQQAGLARAKDSMSYEALILLGDCARLKGDAAAASKYYVKAATMKPNDERAWYGLGVVNTEKEDVGPGRKALTKALELNPLGAGYQGQRGTLETFANKFRDAGRAYQAALDAEPNDYVALTGRGILELKQGNTEQALETLLRAELLEPRYARVHPYKAVAYYRLGYFDQAKEELRRASELDDKDPLPHFMASIIHTDQYEAGKAVDEAREALRLMPYLKSLNQLAVDQQGSANLGRAFSSFGMEEWAQSYAQESYYPFWAGSHLFLADRYSGFFDKNSELFQGYLADPLVFGSSNRFQSLVTQPGNYVTAGYRYGKSSEQTGAQPTLQLNGLWNSSFPISYFINYEPSRITMDTGTDTGTINYGSLTAAVGMKPSYNLGLFLFGNDTNISQTFRTVAGGMVIDVKDDLDSSRGDIGMHYAFSPTSQLWLKAGAFRSSDDIDGSMGGIPVTFQANVKQPEYALRHTFEIGGNELTWGGEYAVRTTDTSMSQEVIPGGFILSPYSYLDRSAEVYISDRCHLGKNLLLQVDVPYQTHLRNASYPDLGWIPPDPPFPLQVANDHFWSSGVNPRAGIVYRFGDGQLVRLAYQDWVRPVAFSTLGQVATAGVPLDDRLVTSGGRTIRARGQVEWEWSRNTFTSAFAERKTIENQPFLNTPFTLTEIEDLFKLQKRSFSNLASDDLMEGSPSFSSGKVTAAGCGLNRVLTDQWSIFARYVYTRALNTSPANYGKELPYLPQNAVAIGTTWVGPHHLFFITRFIHRTEQFTDEANAIRRQASWDGSADLFWESPLKHLLVRVGADEMGDKNDATFYSAEIALKY